MNKINKDVFKKMNVKNGMKKYLSLTILDLLLN